MPRHDAGGRDGGAMTTGPERAMQFVYALRAEDRGCRIQAQAVAAAASAKTVDVLRIVMAKMSG